MPLAVDINRADYDAFLKHVYAQGWTPPRGPTFIVFIVTVLAITALMKFAFPQSALSILLGFLIGCAFSYALLTIYTKSATAALAPLETGYIFGPQQLETSELGITIRSPRHEGLYQWALVAPPVETQDHYFIMLDRIAGIIVPKRDLPSQSHATTFLDAIRSRAKRIS